MKYPARHTAKYVIFVIVQAHSDEIPGRTENPILSEQYKTMWVAHAPLALTQLLFGFCCDGCGSMSFVAVPIKSGVLSIIQRRVARSEE
jgi:hypothetical protein